MSNENKRTCVYVRRDPEGVPIYVGITNWPDRRWRQHESKPWFEAGGRWEILVWCKKRSQAREIELRLIQEHNPPANIADADTPFVDWTRINRARRPWVWGALLVGGGMAMIGFAIEQAFRSVR